MPMGILGFARVQQALGPQGQVLWGGMGIQSIEKAGDGQYVINTTFDTSNAVETATLGTGTAGWIATNWPGNGTQFRVRTGRFQSRVSVNDLTAESPAAERADLLPQRTVGLFPEPADLLFQIVIVGPV